MYICMGYGGCWYLISLGRFELNFIDEIISAFVLLNDF